MLREPADTLLRLLKIPSETGKEAAVAAELRQWIENELPLDTLEFQEVDGRRNLIGVRGSPRLFLTSHMDTVPILARTYEDATHIYGTGACDAKGQIAVQLAAIISAAEQGLKDYGFFYVVGEEVNSVGAKHATRHPKIRGKAVLNGEPTGNRFVSRSRGFQHYIFRTQGKEAHTSVKETDSAIHRLLADLAVLTESELKDMHLNVGCIEGGTSANVVAGQAEAHVSFRPRTRDDVSLARLQAIAAHCDVALYDSLDPVEFYVPAEYQEAAVEVSYCSDAGHYLSAFDHVMMFGPGSIAVAHSQEEQVEKEELESALSVLTSLLLHE